MYARRAVEQAELLRQQKREEQQRLKGDKKFSWNQKVNVTCVLGCISVAACSTSAAAASHSAWLAACGKRSSIASTWPARSLQEKKKRDEGKASRGKSYVEEEKRRAREFGIVSGFD